MNQLKKLNCPVAMLQETYLSDNVHVKLRRDWLDQQYIFAYQNKRKSGVATLINKLVNFSHKQKSSLIRRADM